MKTSACPKLFVLLLSLVLVTSAAAITGFPTGKTWMLSFLTERKFNLKPIPGSPSKLRSTTVEKECLDSIVIYVNDSIGLVGIDSKLQFEYNPFGQLTYQCMSSTDNEEKVLVPEESLVFVYDTKGRMSSDSSYSWDAVEKQWILGGFEEYGYDSDGILMQKVEASINSSAYFSKTMYVYDETGKPLNQTKYLSVDGKQWLLDGKEDFAYHLNGLLATTTRSTWESYNNTWLNRDKTESIYDEVNRDTLTMNYQWNETTNTWRVAKKVVNTFDAKGHKTMEVAYESTGVNSLWTKDSKSEYTFDDKGNLLSDSKYGWDEDSLEWTGYTSVSYTFDQRVGSNDLIMPFQLGSTPYISKLMGCTLYFGVDLPDPWFPIADMTCYYSKKEWMGLLPVTGMQPSWIVLSKTKELRFDAANLPLALRLYDLSGRLVASFEKWNASSLSLQQLKKGCYLLQMESKKGMERGKLVVE